MVEIVDLHDATGTHDPNDPLFDDQWITAYPAPPKPPSEHFYRIPARLQSLQTQCVLVGVPGSSYSGHSINDRAWWDLWGPSAGKQGIMLKPIVSGLMHTPFTHLLSEGPYMVGAVHQRVDWKKREINFGVMVNVGQGPDTTYRYRMLEERWWRSWSAREDAYWGVFTRTHGWRWLRVRLAEDPKDAFQIDPTAQGVEGYMEWNITAVAAQPYWMKRKLVARWDNVGEDGDEPPGTRWDQVTGLLNLINSGLIPGLTEPIPGFHVGEGVINIMNRGTEPAWPLFLVSSPGMAFIEDGPGGVMVQCPLLTPEDGTVLIDTDYMKRTATSAVDPIDPLFYRILRQTQLLDFLLHDVTSSKLPVWRRMKGRFQVPWPPRSVCNIRVRHSEPNGSITCLMPQRYGMSYA